MNPKHGLCGWILSASVVVLVGATGCDKDNQKAGPNVPPAGYKETQDAAAKDRAGATSRGAEAAQRAAAAAAAAAGTTADKAKDAAANTKDAVTNAVNDAKASDAAQNAKATADDVMAKVKADGQTLLDKLDAAIKSNKLDEGQTYVDAFDKIKDKVPAELKAKYDTLKAQLATAKAKAAEPNK